MSTDKQLEDYYNKTINASVALNSQYLFNRGDINAPLLKKAKERLDNICSESDLKLNIYHYQGGDALVIKTKEDELVLQIIMNIITKY